MARENPMEQGAILVEAVIVIPFFLIVWMGLVTLHHGWQARLEAQGRARDGAYRVSNQKDCGNLSVTADALGIGGEADGALAGVAQEALSLMDAVTGGTPFSLEHVKAKATAEVRGVPRLFGGPTARAKAEAILICNERPVDGLVDLVRDKLMSMF